MAKRKVRPAADHWPGFANAMALLLMVIMFLISVFVLVQFSLTQELSGRDAAVARLESRIAELASLLALEQSKKKNLQQQLYALEEADDDAAKKKKELLDLLDKEEEPDDDTVTILKSELSDERRKRLEAQAKVELLKRQLEALRRQLAALEDALVRAEEEDRDKKVKIAELSNELNAALAAKVRELAKARSDFFARLRRILGNRDGFEIVGDRFLLQSEVLFASGAATVNPRGEFELRSLAGIINTISQEIPQDVEWVLRVDGHTDAIPINSARFPSNWHLAMARSIAVVRYLAAQQVDATHLMAVGFAEFQPIDPASNRAAYRRNRRIEFKITQQ